MQLTCNKYSSTVMEMCWTGCLPWSKSSCVRLCSLIFTTTAAQLSLLWFEVNVTRIQLANRLQPNNLPNNLPLHAYLAIGAKCKGTSIFQRTSSCFHLQGRRSRHYILPKRWILPTTSHDITAHKDNVDIFTTTITSNIILKKQVQHSL